MKNTVLKYGLISGAVSIVMMCAVLPALFTGNMGRADLLGYTSMFLAALLVFFGVRSYREGAGGGRLTFGRGFAVGLLITLVSSVCYTAAFQVMYFKLAPGFGDKFQTCMVDHARASGASAQEVEQTAQLARTLKRLYDHPVTNAALALAGTFPVGLVSSAIAAAILRRR